MAHSGYDLFFSEPGATTDERHCRICRTACTVTRNLLGPTSFAEAMSHKNHLHDRFQCPHSEEEWHEQALLLVQEIERTPSKRLADLMRLDLQDLLQEKSKSL
jgi:hypothetical protein